MSKSKQHKGTKKAPKKSEKAAVEERSSLVSPEEAGTLDRLGIETSSGPDPDGFAYSLRAGGFRVDFDSEAVVKRLARALGKHIEQIVELAVRDALRAAKESAPKNVLVKKVKARGAPGKPVADAAAPALAS
ncbi:MAG: hypothetical protein ACYCWW_07965 [Deltaproteobacteria bacterium]